MNQRSILLILAILITSITNSVAQRFTGSDTEGEHATNTALIANEPAGNYNNDIQKTDSINIKIGQMILIGIGDRKGIEANDPLLKDIADDKVGGILLFEKNIASANSFNQLQALIQTAQKKATTPLFVSIDEEGGKVHRLKEKYGFVAMPSAQYLGNLDNTDSTTFYNQRLSHELSQLGINLNYAPCLDLAINPKNTVLVTRERCFSTDPAITVRHAQACIDAHHENRVLTVVKHFPGHGSSTADSHLGLVDVTQTWSDKELQPYLNLIEKDKVDVIMTAHIMNNKWDAVYPATLSSKVVTGMLRNKLHYKGVVVSDDMQMYAISKIYGFEKAIQLAVNAGVDLLMFGNNVTANEKPLTAEEIHRTIKNLVTQGKISKSRINESYKRIMLLKGRL